MEKYEKDVRIFFLVCWVREGRRYSFCCPSFKFSLFVEKRKRDRLNYDFEGKINLSTINWKKVFYYERATYVYGISLRVLRVKKND